MFSKTYFLNSSGLKTTTTTPQSSVRQTNRTHPLDVKKKEGPLNILLGSQGHKILKDFSTRYYTQTIVSNKLRSDREE